MEEEESGCKRVQVLLCVWAGGGTGGRGVGRGRAAADNEEHSELILEYTKESRRTWRRKVDASRYEVVARIGK